MIERLEDYRDDCGMSRVMRRIRGRGEGREWGGGGGRNNYDDDDDDDRDDGDRFLVNGTEINIEK